jgi:hypothetical protein
VVRRSGSPIRRLEASARKRSRNSSAIGSSSSSREPAMQACPWLWKIAKAEPLTAAEVGVGEHDVGALAAQLQLEPLEVAGGGPHDLAADLGRAGEGDLLDVRVGGQPRARASW